MDKSIVQFARSGLNPTASVIAPYLLEVLDKYPNGVTRANLVDFVEAEWNKIPEASLPPRGATQAVKKALANLKAEGKIVNPHHRLWMLAEVSAPSLSAHTDPAGTLHVGEGHQAVYVFHLTEYRGSYKIGMTARKVEERMAQYRTSLPEPPVLDVVFHCYDARGLEQVFHSVLKFRGKQINLSGAEWFDTSLDEILDIYRFL